jgi:hypothetical protein
MLNDLSSRTTDSTSENHKCRPAANGENIMLLENKNAIIYGAAGSVGGAVTRAFAREGAHVFLTGRNLGALDVLAKEISAAGGAAATAQVDALDEDAVEAHLDAVVDKAGTVDISGMWLPLWHPIGPPITAGVDGAWPPLPPVWGRPGSRTGTGRPVSR